LAGSEPLLHRNEQFAGAVLCFCHAVQIQKQEQRGGDMLRFFCPTAETYFDSGVFIDEETLRRRRLDIIAVTCPLCERKHRFLLADAVRVEDAA
jgi:hypothetical protein